MVFTACFLFAKMPGIQSQIKQSYGHLTHLFFSLHAPSFSSLQSTTPSSSSSSSSSYGTRSKISPTILFTIVIVALIVFVSGLIHLLVRFLLKRTSYPSVSQSNRHPSSDQTSGSGSLFQRQLQQLFHLHDSGLDQASIDALPLFLYKEIMGPKEPFDCAVCLSEFSQQDKLRLLPLCSHAFHIDCIDTWLLSNSTCPVCRGSISTTDYYMENPVFDFDCPREQEEDEEAGETDAQKRGEDEIVSEKRVFAVRLGKFKSTNGGREREEGETTSSNLDLDGRRCYSLGSFQYVVGNSNLEVALCYPNRTSNSNGGLVKGRASQNGNSIVDGDVEGKKINIRSKGESFSVSKIWLWSKKGKFPSSSDNHMVTPSANVSLPWIDRAQGR